MAFMIDPRVCLLTGEDVSGQYHPCCGTDSEYYGTDNKGLLGGLRDRRMQSSYRVQPAKPASQAKNDPRLPQNQAAPSSTNRVSLFLSYARACSQTTEKAQLSFKKLRSS